MADVTSLTSLEGAASSSGVLLNTGCLLQVQPASELLQSPIWCSSVTPSPTAQVPKPPTVSEGSASEGSLELATPAVQAEQAHRPRDHAGGGDKNTPVFNLHARLDAAG